MTSRTRLLHGDTIRLTALCLEDVPTLAAWDQDTEFRRLYDARPARPRSQAELAAWLEGRREDSNAFTFGIRPLNDGTLIGTVELDGILWPHRVCGLAIAIGERSNWGKGYGSEAACLMIAFAFQELNLHRITATIFDYNKRSINLVERLGFCREGAFRGFLERDGVRHDMLLYGLLRPEWKAAQREE